MRPRDPTEAHRTSTPLELLVDLTFVVAIAQAVLAFHHEILVGNVRHAVFAYPSVFFAIWWAWMNFSWFASAFDNDDIPYRIATFVQMAGVLVLAAGIQRAFTVDDFVVVTVGYVIMRLGLVAQWLRAGRHPGVRRTAHRYAVGIGLCQVGWLALLAVPGTASRLGFLIMACAELAVPIWAEAAGVTTWHPEHIEERYGLFTIIVLGESILAATLAVQDAAGADGPASNLVLTAFGGLLTVFAMWWIYFDQPGETAVSRARPEREGQRRWAFLWGYGHYFVFASAAAVGNGIATAVDASTGSGTLTRAAAGLTLTIPVAIYLVSTWLVGSPRRYGAPGLALPATAALLIAASGLPRPTLVTGALLSCLVAFGHLSDKAPFTRA